MTLQSRLHASTAWRCGEEAVEYSGSVRDDKAKGIAAEKYANVAIKAAEKLAAKKFGPMLKHADSEGNKITVNILQFGIGDKPTPLESITVEAVEVVPAITVQTGDNKR